MSMTTDSNAASAAPISEVKVVRATVRDAEGIARLVNSWAAQGQMLPRTLGETYENLRDFFVVRDDDGNVVQLDMRI